MAGLERSTISFRRQGSSGIVWDDRLITEFNQQANDEKGETQQQDEQAKVVMSEGQQDQTLTAGEGIKAIMRSGGGIERSSSNGGGATRHHKNTGRVSPAMDPPSPRVSAFGCCYAFGKKPNGQRKRPPLKQRKSK